MIHKTAKDLLVQVITDNAGGVGSIGLSIERECEYCFKRFRTAIPMYTFSAARAEVRVGSFVCDVVGYRKEKEIALAFEVRHKHAVEEAKAKSLEPYWVELKAEDVLLNPYAWRPVNSKLKALRCEDCRKPGAKPIVQISYSSPVKKFNDVIRKMSGF
jgi:hypothetical protein